MPQLVNRGVSYPGRSWEPKLCFWVKTLYSLLLAIAFSILWMTCLETPDPDRDSQQYRFEAQAVLLPHPHSIHKHSQLMNTQDIPRTLCKEMGIKAKYIFYYASDRHGYVKGKNQNKTCKYPVFFWLYHQNINKVRDYCLTSLLWGTHKRRLLGHVFNPAKIFISQPVTTLGVSDLSVAPKFVSTKSMLWVECFR